MSAEATCERPARSREFNSPHETASQLLWSYIGRPPHELCAAGASAQCWQCGGYGDRHADVTAWMGSSYTAQNSVLSPGSHRICEACVTICARLTPVPGRPPKPGKQHGGNMRNYSHMLDASGPDNMTYSNAAKNEVGSVWKFLCEAKRGRWFCAVAISGQKHVIPTCPVNAPGRAGRIGIDDGSVSLPAGESRAWKLRPEICALLTAGASKTMIASGRYSHNFTRKHCAAIRGFEHQWARARGSGWWDLCLALARKDDVTNG